MKVVCFYWQGDRWQEDGFSTENNPFNHHIKKVGKVDHSLPAQYVNNLYRGVKRFASQDFQFICFSNQKLEVDEGIEVRSFPMVTQRGVLPRLYMFSEASGLFGHQVLCLDLDVVIVGGLQDIMAYDGLFCARSKFRRGEEYKLDGDIMSFRAGKEAEERFWTPFVQDVKAAEKLTQGRERYWMRHVAGDIADRWDEVAPGQVVSFKRHVKRREKLPPHARIVSCHGYPRPHEVDQDWIKKYWN